MEVISIERSTYEKLLTSFNSFVSQMMAMGSRGTDKRLGEWLESGCVPDTEYQPKDFTDAPSERNVGILSNRA